MVGISDYPPESGFPKLQFAAKDAQDLASVLQKQGYKTQVLTDNHAMKSSIRKALQQAHDELNQGKVGNAPQGTIVFAFSGHGGQTGTGVNARQYLVTYDYSPDDPDPGFPLKDIAAVLTDAGAARKMMFIDACRNLEASGSKSAPPLSAFSDLLHAEGLKIFYSTAPGARSYEDPKSQNGYFTHFLLEGLSGKAAKPDGLVTFDSLATWVTRTMKSDSNTYQTPYWNQAATGDFYVAGQLTKKVALVVGIDHYEGHPLQSAIAGAKEVDQQLDHVGFDATYLEDVKFNELRAQVGAFAKGLPPKDFALFYFAGEGGIASGQPFLMAADAKYPTTAAGGKWEKVPDNALKLAELMDIVRQNHPGPNVFLLDVGLMRASSADTLDLPSLRKEHTLVLFSCRPGVEPRRSDAGSLFSQTFVTVSEGTQHVGGLCSFSHQVGDFRSIEWLGVRGRCPDVAGSGVPHAIPMNSDNSMRLALATEPREENPMSKYFVRAALVACLSTLVAISVAAQDTSSFKSDGVKSQASGPDSNIKNNSALNSEDQKIPAPESKGGPKAKGGAACVIDVNNETPYIVGVYMNGDYEGTVARWGNG